ncbi:BamA/TamA family outer membrane protein [Flavobacterium selenitireducens]|uniref:hypothetical protein n=1 Tax=Flavobacterium selenitireducens TaxID=2722704 RepID=UPI00168A765A|nr:hypothetical protein [Flavobacterium selenitireducens]MBD3581104.1 hypothetical protein [Flavobacterium selenitireducens]
MPSVKKFCLLVFALLIGSGAFSQTTEQQAKQDSAAVYRKIEKYSKKRKWTSFVHGLIFEPLTPNKLKARKRAQARRFKDYQGKIVRKIDIITLDPFGYSETDTTRKPSKSLAHFGNRLHLKTKRLTILNLILIRRNKPLDSLLIKESERLIRTQRYVRRVQITPKATTHPDSVDIEIRELDSWSLIPDFSASTSRTDYKLTERNFLGLGHQVEQRYQKDLRDGDDAYSAKYTIPNVMNTYVRTVLAYQLDLRQNYLKGINIERPFFSPFARWAGGVYFDTRFRGDSLPNANNELSWQHLKTNATDIWAGHSIRLFDGSSEDEKTTRLITTARYYKLRFTESPTAEYDSINFFATERNYLLGLGISSRQFVQDQYLFNYGIIEDVPVGEAFGITGGMQRKHNRWRTYLGARVTSGEYHAWGYLSGNLEYGTYLRSGVSEQSVLSAQANYFTPLYETGKWKFRQFVKGSLIIGNDREPSWGDRLTLKGSRGIQGLESRSLFGTKKWLVTSQTQSYAPWDVWGFRFNPYLTYSIGMLGDGPNGFKKSKAYSQVGAGFIITNDYLVFSSFQISFSYYPTMPDTDSGAFKTNSFSTEDFGLMDFELAKPRTVLYEQENPINPSSQTVR